MPQRVFNWGRNQSCQPVRFVVPRDEGQLSEVMLQAAREGLRVRVVGAHHSWSGAALSDDVLVSLDGMQDVLEQRGREVTVQGGIRLAQLNLALAERGLALPNLGSIDQQSIAGAISTATHGSGRGHGVMSTAVRGLRLMGPDGQVQQVSAQQRPELFDAARAGLGMFGVITGVTLGCVPAFRLLERTVPMAFDEVVQDLDALSRAHEFPRLWWLPHTDRMQLFAIDRTEEPSTRPTLEQRLDGTVLNPYLFPLVLKAGAAAPAVVPALNRLIASAYFAERRKVGASHEVLHIPMPPRHLESEYAVPIERAGEALTGLRALIQREQVKVNFVQEFRFVKADTLPLSPAYGRDSAYISAYSALPRDMPRFLSAFERLMEELDGRPHWGKLFNRAPGQLRDQYPQWDRVMALRAQVDPEGRLLNPFTEALVNATRA